MHLVHGDRQQQTFWAEFQIESTQVVVIELIVVDQEIHFYYCWLITLNALTCIQNIILINLN